MAILNAPLRLSRVLYPTGSRLFASHPSGIESAWLRGAKPAVAIATAAHWKISSSAFDFPSVAGQWLIPSPDQLRRFGIARQCDSRSSYLTREMTQRDCTQSHFAGLMKVRSSRLSSGRVCVGGGGDVITSSTSNCRYRSCRGHLQQFDWALVLYQDSYRLHHHARIKFLRKHLFRRNKAHANSIRTTARDNAAAPA